MPSPLADVRVLDASSFISGPLAGTMLADLGATVIKVEPEGGDGLIRFGRVVDGRGIIYANCNRGKAVIGLDLKTDAGRARFLDLAAGADVLITNWRAGVVERLGLSDRLGELTSLIWLQITGWGPDGPLAERPAFDGSVQAMTGLAWSQGDAEPQLLRTFIADKAAATFGAQAVAAALYERTRTGRGDVIELPMLDALSYFNFPDHLQNRTVLGDAPESPRNEQIAANRPVRTADGWVVVSPVGGKQLKAALEAVGRPEVIDELRAAPNQHALTSRFVEVLGEVLPSRTTEAWQARFDAGDVPLAPILDIDDHLAHPQVLHNEIYDVVDDPVHGPSRRARFPARFGVDPVRGSTTSAHVLDPAVAAWPDRDANP